MNTLDYTCMGIAFAALLSAAFVIIFCRLRTRKSLETISKMLDTAIDGSFSENILDESVLSAVEAKMARFLSVCSASSKTLNEEKDKIKSLISDISHQTKTPLANILLYAQLLGEQALTQEGAFCVKALSTQGEKLNFLISALVKTSRLETGIITVSPKLEIVQRLLDDVQKQILPEAEAKGVAIAVESTSINACFDLKWTTEAIYNILDNAVKYTENGGSISIQAYAYELFCRIDITDTGIGIAENEHSKIFTRFYRSPAVSNQEGVGVGLYLAREIVAAENGYIKVSSHLAYGSTFSVFLPMGL